MIVELQKIVSCHIDQPFERWKTVINQEDNDKNKNHQKLMQMNISELKDQQELDMSRVLDLLKAVIETNSIVSLNKKAENEGKADV